MNSAVGLSVPAGAAGDRTVQSWRAAMAAVLDLDRLRIARSLHRRIRYKYVQPRIEAAEQGGWVVISPNCSRNVDPQGGDIPIAWLQPIEAGWLLHRPDHGQGCWCAFAGARSLPPLLDLLVLDSQRDFWV